MSDLEDFAPGAVGLAVLGLVAAPPVRRRLAPVVEATGRGGKLVGSAVVAAAGGVVAAVRGQGAGTAEQPPADDAAVKPKATRSQGKTASG